MKKDCIKCGKRVTEKSKSTDSWTCHDCVKKYQARWREKNRENIRKYQLKYCHSKAGVLARERYRKEHYDKIRAGRLRYRLKLKEQVFTHYAGNPPKCQCCGEKERGFLTVDHINGGGQKAREISHSSTYMLRDIIRDNFPLSFQILCFNCNCGREHAGGKDKICPHKQ